MVIDVEPQALRVRAASAFSRGRGAILLPLLILLIAGGILVPAADRVAAADDRLGARVATLCSSCHLLDGRHTGIPPIIIWEAEELVDKMVAFRANERANRAMRAVSLSLSDDEISAVADHLAALGKKARSP